MIAATSPTPFASSAAIKEAIGRLAAELAAAHPEGFVAVGMLKGGVIFLSDLVRKLDVPVAIDFLSISSFEPDSGRVRIVKDLDQEIEGRDVVLVTDVVDTGLALGFVRQDLLRRNPRSLETCALLDKQERRILPWTPEYVGFTAPEGFFLGYGLDYGGLYRNLDSLAVAKLEELHEDPRRYVRSLYASTGRETR